MKDRAPSSAPPPSLKKLPAPQLGHDAPGISLEGALLAALDSPDRQLRSEAIADAARLVDPQSLLPALADDSNDERRNAAIQALTLAGSRGVSTVIRALRDPDPEVVMFAAGILGKSRDAAAILHLVQLVDHEDINVAQQAIDSLANLRASVAVEELVKVLDRDPWLRFAAVHALGEIGDSRAVGSLVPLLSDELVGEAAIEALGKIGSPEALGHLARMLRESADTATFSACLRAIGKVLEQLPNDEEIWRIPAFARLGSEEETDVHLRVMSLLSAEPVAPTQEDQELRGAAMEMIRALRLRPLYLTLVMAGRDPDMRDRVQFCAVSIGADLSSPLVLGLQAPNTNVRALACECLGILGQREAAPAVAKLLRDRDVRVRVAAATTAGRFEDASCIPVLVEMLSDIAKDVRQAAVAALARMPQEAVTALLFTALPNDLPARVAALEIARTSPDARQRSFIGACVDHEDADVRSAAVRALAAQPGHDIIDVLGPLLGDRDLGVRTQVLAALGSSHDRRARQLLLQEIENDPDALGQVVRALGRLGDGDATLAPHLIEMYARAKPFVRLAIIETLADLKEVCAEPMLVGLLGDGDPNIRRAAVRALGQYATKTAVRRVLAATRDPESDVRVAVIEVLSRVDGPSARAALERLCLDADPRVATAARRYLDEL